MKILDINGKKVDWDKSFTEIRKICKEIVTEEYACSCLPRKLAECANEMLSFGFFDPNRTLVKSLTKDFRSILEFTIKGSCAEDKEYARLYERIAREKRETLEMFGIRDEVHQFSEIYKKALDKIWKNVPDVQR